MSRRQVGTRAARLSPGSGSTSNGAGARATVTPSPATASSVSTPTRSSSSRCSPGWSTVPKSRLILDGRNTTLFRSGSSGAVSTRLARTAPPAHSSMSLAQRSAPIRASRNSWPFSKRRLASDRRAYRCPVRRIVTGSKIADSTMTDVVVLDTSEDAPPMIPAMASGRSVSAMTSVSGSRDRSTWSSVSRRSPARASRTMRRERRAESGATTAASKTWTGLPSSSIT